MKGKDAEQGDMAPRRCPRDDEQFAVTGRRDLLLREHPHPERFHPDSDVGPEDDRCPDCGFFHHPE